MTTEDGWMQCGGQRHRILLRWEDCCSLELVCKLDHMFSKDVCGALAFTVEDHACMSVIWKIAILVEIQNPSICLSGAVAVVSSHPLMVTRSRASEVKEKAGGWHIQLGTDQVSNLGVQRYASSSISRGAALSQL